MRRPVFCVDFNEMVDADTVLLSVEDTKVDASGVPVRLYEGLLISVYMTDLDENGHPDNLIANGIAVRNVSSGWASHVKWCCRIDSDGVRPQSEVDGKKDG